jgi:hypothetical protein
MHVSADVTELTTELLAICDVVKQINVGSAARTLKQIHSVLALKSPIRGTVLIACVYRVTHSD